MHNKSIREISLKGFIVILSAILFIASFSYYSLTQISNYNKKHNFYESTYNYIFEFKYYTENLLTTTNLNKTLKQWKEKKEDFRRNIQKMKNNDDIKTDSEIFIFWNTIDLETKKIEELLSSTFFQEKNMLEKSILRRFGEDLNSNKKSDHYNTIFNLKNSIDYTNQYQEFLLDEINILKITQEKQITKNIKQTEVIALISILLIILASSIFIYLIQKRIKETENDILLTKASLQDSLNEINYILNTAMESIIIEKNNKIINVNKSMTNIFKYKKDHLLNKNISKLISPIFIEKFEMLKKETASNIFEIECISKDNKIFPCLIKTYKFKNKYDEILNIYAILDLTEVKKKDKLLFQQSKMAAMGEMIENIAHQWRQPLSIISTTASGALVQKEFGMLAEQSIKEYFTQIVETSKHLSETIDDFRSFYSNNKSKKEFKLFDAIIRAEKLLSSKLKNRGIELINEVENLNILGYENEFIQVIMNIINNAQDEFEKIKEKRKIIIITGKKEDDDIVISITDNAGGIKENIINKIFDEYFTTKDSSNGTGIGLYMSKKIIEKIGAKIEVSNEKYTFENENYIGAKFKINIPI